MNLVVDSTHHAVLEKYIGKPVVFGIRPENLGEKDEASPGSGTSFSANVDVVEPMGSEIYLYVDLAGQPLTARIKADREPKVNQSHVLHVAMHRAHYFDPDTEQAIV
jgi:multiple sugar transport system ATP-binding protein